MWVLIYVPFYVLWPIYPSVYLPIGPAYGVGIGMGYSRGALT
jgi:hypothetical protein